MDWPKIKESFHLVRLQITIACFHFIEWIKVFFNYYSHLTFALLDLTVLALSFWQNPFRICRQFKEQKLKSGEKDVEHYTYGETPLTTMDQIVQAFQIGADAHILEMGSGRGRLSFFLSQIKGFTVTGIENVPALYQIAFKAYRLFKPKNVDFVLEDFFLTSYENYDVIYLFGTTLSDEKIDILCKRFREVKKGTQIITVSFPLPSDDFEVMQVISCRFDFGAADVFLQTRV
jgi:SAM-dependent methyltransferase